MGAGKEALVMTAGLPVGNGLSARAAKELGLVEGTAVGSGVIDACESRRAPRVSPSLELRSSPFLRRAVLTCVVDVS